MSQIELFLFKHCKYCTSHLNPPLSNISNLKALEKTVIAPFTRDDLNHNEHESEKHTCMLIFFLEVSKLCHLCLWYTNNMIIGFPNMQERYLCHLEIVLRCGLHVDRCKNATSFTWRKRRVGMSRGNRFICSHEKYGCDIEITFVCGQTRLRIFFSQVECFLFILSVCDINWMVEVITIFLAIENGPGKFQIPAPV